MRGPAVVVAFAAATVLLGLFKAYHVDEPFFLAVARQILRDPAHPLDFIYNWYGWSVPAGPIFIHSVLVPYILAGAFKIVGGGEVALRLACLPFDIGAAAALYAIAARFLKKPLWPVLIVLASPVWVLCLPPLMAEKWLMFFALTGLWSLMRWLESRQVGWLVVSMLLSSLAVTVKHSAVFMLAPAAVLLYRARRSRWLIAMVVLVPLVAAVVDMRWLEESRYAAELYFMRQTSSPTWAERIHHLRALLAFSGGLALVGLIWPFLGEGSLTRPRVAAALACAAFLFLPILDRPDLTPRSLDRFVGILWSWGALLSAQVLLGPRSRGLPGWGFWSSWICAGAALTLANWFISARSLLLFLPAATLALAAELESRLIPSVLTRTYAATFAAVLVVSLSLAWVDSVYAGAQRRFAGLVRGLALDEGWERVWFTGHWGLQYYLEEAGAAPLDEGRGGWALVREGDAVVVPSINSNIQPPRNGWFNVRKLAIDEGLPLRLMGRHPVQAGFHSDMWGFLPYAIDGGPVEEFSLYRRSDRQRPP